MLWYLPWSESIKKRACRYLLQRYLGNFLEEKLTLDQLSVDLYNGTGTVCDVSLDCDVSLFYYIATFPLILFDKYIDYMSVLSSKRVHLLANKICAIKQHVLYSWISNKGHLRSWSNFVTMANLVRLFNVITNF